jgi:hypothetical protein
MAAETYGQMVVENRQLQTPAYRSLFNTLLKKNVL